MSETFLANGEVRLRLMDEGEGAPVLLLDGFPDSSRLWRLQTPARWILVP